MNEIIRTSLIREIEMLRSQNKHLMEQIKWQDNELAEFRKQTHTNKEEPVPLEFVPSNKDAILQPELNPKLIQNARNPQLKVIYNQALIIQDIYPCSSYMIIIADHIINMINKEEYLRGISENIPPLKNYNMNKINNIDKEEDKTDRTKKTLNPQYPVSPVNVEGVDYEKFVNNLMKENLKKSFIGPILRHHEPINTRHYVFGKFTIIELRYNNKHFYGLSSKTPNDVWNDKTAVAIAFWRAFIELEKSMNETLGIERCGCYMILKTF